MTTAETSQPYHASGTGSVWVYIDPVTATAPNGTAMWNQSTVDNSMLFGSNTYFGAGQISGMDDTSVLAVGFMSWSMAYVDPVRGAIDGGVVLLTPEPCQSNPCQNGGNCFSLTEPLSLFTCICAPGSGTMQDQHRYVRLSQKGSTILTVPEALLAYSTVIPQNNAQGATIAVCPDGTKAALVAKLISIDQNAVVIVMRTMTHCVRSLWFRPSSLHVWTHSHQLSPFLEIVAF